MEFEDKTLNCIECNNDFTWTGGEQSFFAQQNFSPPKRCPTCRRARKAGIERNKT